MNSENTVGFTSATPQNLIIDSGALYKNWGETDEALIGATSGGNTFTVKQNTRQVKVDGIKGSAKDLNFPTDTEVTLGTNILEVTSDILKIVLNGAVDNATDPDYDIITGKTTIATTDYLKNIALVGKISGKNKPCVIILYNALNTDGLKWVTKDDTDNVLQCTFTAFIDPTTPNVLPYKIQFPKA